jgi:hypothetical protein
MPVQSLQPALPVVFFSVNVILVRNVIFRYVDLTASLKSVPVLCLHLEVSPSKPTCTQKEQQHIALQTSVLETNSLHSSYSHEMPGSFMQKL